MRFFIGLAVCLQLWTCGVSSVKIEIAHIPIDEPTSPAMPPTDSLDITEETEEAITTTLKSSPATKITKQAVETTEQVESLYVEDTTATTLDATTGAESKSTVESALQPDTTSTSNPQVHLGSTAEPENHDFITTRVTSTENSNSQENTTASSQRDAWKQPFLLILLAAICVSFLSILAWYCADKLPCIENERNNPLNESPDSQNSELKTIAPLSGSIVLDATSTAHDSVGLEVSTPINQSSVRPNQSLFRPSAYQAVSQNDIVRTI